MIGSEGGLYFLNELVKYLYGLNGIDVVLVHVLEFYLKVPKVAVLSFHHLIGTIFDFNHVLTYSELVDGLSTDFQVYFQ